ncbi:ATP phosphoribosyltransferase [Actinopolyspora mortivallis]|uniref:ATP phosphoribosyltransferase n=1 Tax=Actinopolyspora mortivallis TaxID=33906 RepID=A0A2T0GUK5_ACTMO|nr:ATP phosphoribosyltransferase [Actinopolyspora mortivallis]
MLMLRVAVPNKGSLHGPTIQLLDEAGYRLHREHRALFAEDRANNVRFIFWRASDIARNVGAGILDVGITGQDLLAGAGTAAHTTELLPLGFGGSEFYFAAASGGPIRSVRDLDGRRVATSFPLLVERAAREHDIEIRTVELDGAVETAVELGLADAIADVVETGSSLRAAGLETLGEPIMRSQAVLVRGADSPLSPEREQAVRVLLQRLQGVLDARSYVVMDYNCPQSALETATAITPGKESPTVSSLTEPGWVAVRSMVPRDDVQSVMDRLAEVGATEILVTRLEACRL